MCHSEQIEPETTVQFSQEGEPEETSFWTCVLQAQGLQTRGHALRQARRAPIFLASTYLAAIIGWWN
jgi:hypothetical protein